MELKAAALAGHGIPTISLSKIPYRQMNETTERCQRQCMRVEHALV